jgi:tellurite resistance protein TehA-like permease
MHMRVFIWLFVGFLIFELLLLGCSALAHNDHPLLFSPIIPAIWIAMAIGGVHSAGLLSVASGLMVTAFLYAVVAFALFLFWSKVVPEKNTARGGAR